MLHFKINNTDSCPCCFSSDRKQITFESEYIYYQCIHCEMIFIEPTIINDLDSNKVHFNNTDFYQSDNYWQDECRSAKSRAFGVALARMSELMYYSRIKVSHFIDIGSGPGYFLDAIAKYLPSHKQHFYAIEKFTVPDKYVTKEPNYLQGDLSNLTVKFDAGMCIEVAEHLTPKMLRNLFIDISKIANPGAIFLFNTGMPDYVLNYDMDYLDFQNRGHVCSYSIKSLELLLAELDFKVWPIENKNYAFCVEYKPTTNIPIWQRTWTALQDNLSLLEDAGMGEVLRILGMETARLNELPVISSMV